MRIAVTLNGAPASFTISGVPAGAAGTAFSGPATLSVVAKDTDGNTILGTYAQTVTLTDGDATGATNASVNFAPALQPIVASTMTVNINQVQNTAPVTASEIGWTNAPYDRAIQAATPACTTFAGASPSSGTAFTVTSGIGNRRCGASEGNAGTRRFFVQSRRFREGRTLRS
jgi:hypothetical protein